MFVLIKKIFIGLLTSIVSAYNHTKCVSFRNQRCMIQPTLINLHPNEYSQEFLCYPFAIKLDSCAESCNTLNYCVSNKTEDLNLSMFKMITGINKAHIMRM